MRTEEHSPRFEDLDAWPSLEAVQAMFEGQLSAVAAVREALPAIVKAGEAAALRLAEAGRLVYAGAGTSGRIGVQDGAELSPTFDWPEERVAFAIAGGERALKASAEDAEDDRGAAKRALTSLAIGARDVVIGVAASGATPYTLEFVEGARDRGALTVGVANNPGAPLLSSAEHPILIDTGPEVLAGSTRMKAGTATKLVLNMISTAVMIRLGHVHGNLMVNVQPRNSKLEDRARRIIAQEAEVSYERAGELLREAGESVKVAIVMARLHLDCGSAEAKLARAGGRISEALKT